MKKGGDLARFRTSSALERRKEGRKELEEEVVTWLGRTLSLCSLSPGTGL
jgi:hypothetical protein